MIPPIFTETKSVLIQTIEMLDQLSLDEYTRSLPVLSNSSIGAHTRHIIELFQKLLDGYASGCVNYDTRERNREIELNIDFAIEKLAVVIAGLEKENKNLYLVTIYNQQEEKIESNYFRELMYNLEHCVHHQAIIKIGMMSFEDKTIHEDFGVAKSTLAYRKNVHGNFS